jgi:hypothetical protein
VRDSSGLLGSTQITVNLAAASSSSGVSPDGTTVPLNASQIIDNAGTVWTIGAGGAILRNGSQAAYGWGSQIVFKNSMIYVLGGDSKWWQWTGGWTNVGSTIPGTTSSGGVTSPDGTTVPLNASQIIDGSRAVWTIGSGGAILRNGSQAAYGWGSQIVWKNSTIYVLGGDSKWWQWTGSGWTNVGWTIPGGATSGGGTTSPDGTTVPLNASQIIDGSGAVWTIGINSVVLRNGAMVQGWQATKILWKSSTIYVLGMDGNWWQWAGSTWVNVGGTQP